MISENFDFGFVTLQLGFFVYIVCPSVLSLSNLKIHNTIEVKNNFFPKGLDNSRQVKNL